MADELGLTVDEEQFEEAQAASKEASKVQKKGTKDVVKLDVHDIAALEKNPAVPKSDDLAKYRKHPTRCHCQCGNKSRLQTTSSLEH